jgi:hypothetical protein
MKIKNCLKEYSTIYEHRKIIITNNVNLKYSRSHQLNSYSIKNQWIQFKGIATSKSII